jgi:hypothetical protein
MNTIQEAMKLITLYEDCASEFDFKVATMYLALAQVEQMQRIADALERLADNSDADADSNALNQSVALYKVG